MERWRNTRTGEMVNGKTFYYEVGRDTLTLYDRVNVRTGKDIFRFLVQVPFYLVREGEHILTLSEKIKPRLEEAVSKAIKEIRLKKRVIKLSKEFHYIAIEIKEPYAKEKTAIHGREQATE